MDTESPGIRQRRWLWGAIEHRLLDERTARSRVAAAGRLQEHAVDLATLDPQPVRVRRRAIPAAIGAWLLGAGALGSAIAAATVDPYSEAAPGFGLLAALLLVPFAVCFVRSRRSSFDLLVFQGLQHDIPLLYDRPDRATFAPFVLELERRIRAARQALAEAERTAPRSATATELASLAALHEQGVLSAVEFQDAKRRVLTSLGAAGGLDDGGD